MREIQEEKKERKKRNIKRRAYDDLRVVVDDELCGVWNCTSSKVDQARAGARLN
jgi:hypothetical protein